MIMDIDDKVAATLKRLEAEAAARQMPLNDFLDLVIGVVPAPRLAPVELAEFDAILDELVNDTEPHPPLPEDFSRADIYADHD